VSNGNGPTRVVVGVDGSAGASAAVRWAIGEAAARGSELHAVLAWQYHHAVKSDPTGVGSLFLAFRPSGGGIEPFAPSGWDIGSMPPSAAEMGAAGEDEEEDVASRTLDQALDGVDLSRVKVVTAAIEGHAAQVLLDYVHPDDLLVVGSRGHGQFAGALLGSISQHVVTHACCPVTVVPGTSRHRS